MARICFKYYLLEKNVIPRLNSIVTDLSNMLEDVGNILIPDDFKYNYLKNYLSDNYYNIINNYNDIIDHIYTMNKDLTNYFDEIDNRLININEINKE